MNKLWLRKLLSYLFPEGLVLLGAVAFLRPGGLPAWTLPLVEAYASIVLIAALLLGWYARRSRILFAVVLLVLADRALVSVMSPSSGQSDSPGMYLGVLFYAVAFLLPLNLLGLSLVSERTFAGLREVAIGVLILLQVGLVFWLGAPGHEEWASSLGLLLVDPRYTQWTPLPQLSLLTFGIAIMLLTVRFGSTQNKIEKGTVWALLACFVAFQNVHIGWSSTNYLATAGLIFIIAVFAEMHRGAYYDQLTSIPSRQALEQALFDPGKRYAIALVEIDRLKELNVQYGYALRNEALRLVAKKLSSMPSLAKAFRYSDERYAVLYREKDLAEVITHLESLRNMVETSPIVLSKRMQPLAKPAPETGVMTVGQSLPVTVSIGVAERDTKKPKPDDVLKAAEKMLFRAKRGGGNQLKAEHQTDAEGISKMVGRMGVIHGPAD